MKHGINVFIENVYAGFVVNIFVIEETGSGRFNISQSKEDGLLEKTKMPTTPVVDNNVKPLLSLPKDIADAFFREIQSQLLREGIRPDSESVNEGKLIAKDEHLKDMQMIVRKLLKIE